MLTEVFFIRKDFYYGNFISFLKFYITIVRIDYTFILKIFIFKNNFFIFKAYNMIYIYIVK